MSVRKFDLEKMTQLENRILAQEEKARALAIKTRNEKMNLQRSKALAVMDYLNKVNIDGSNIPLLLGSVVHIMQLGPEKVAEIEKLGHRVINNPDKFKVLSEVSAPEVKTEVASAEDQVEAANNK